MKRITASAIVALLILSTLPHVASVHTPSSGVLPNITDAKTGDIDADGRVDQYVLTFASSVSGTSPLHANHFVMDGVPGLSITGSGTTRTVTFPERYAMDGDEKPKLEYKKDGYTLTEVTAKTDGVKPIMTGAFAAVDATSVTVTFSEGVRKWVLDSALASKIDTDHVEYKQDGAEIDVTVDHTIGHDSLTITLSGGKKVKGGDTVAIKTTTTTSDVRDMGTNVLLPRTLTVGAPEIVSVLANHGSRDVLVRYNMSVQDETGAPLSNQDFDVSNSDSFTVEHVAGQETVKLRLNNALLDLPNFNVTPRDDKVYAYKRANVEASDAGTPSPAAVDGRAPYITSIIARDINANGFAENLTIVFSEHLDRAAIEGADNALSVAEAANWGVTWPDGSTDLDKAAFFGKNVLYLERDEGTNATRTTGPNVQLSYTAGTGAPFVDLAGTPLANLAAFAAEDWAKPKLYRAETIDNDKDGLLDGYKLFFTENLKASTLNPAHWTVAGISTINTLQANSNQAHILYLNFTEAPAVKSGHKPALGTTDGRTLSDPAGNIVIDVDGGDHTIADKAQPVLESVTSAAGSTKITLTFSEPVQQLSYTDFTYVNAGTSGGTQSISSAPGDFTHTPNTATAEMTVSPALVAGDFGNDKIRAKSNEVHDAAGNAAPSVDVTLTTSGNTFQVNTLTTRDGPTGSANGTLDAIEMKFSAVVDEDTLNPADWSVSAPYKIRGICTQYLSFATAVNCNGGTGEADSDTVFLHIYRPGGFTNEGDTAAVPTVSYPAGGVQSVGGATLQTFTNKATVDGAGPAIVYAAGNVGSNQLTVLFSEDVERYNNGQGGPLLLDSFTYQDAGGATSGASGITGTPQKGADDKTWILTVNANFKTGDIGASGDQLTARNSGNGRVVEKGLGLVTSGNTVRVTDVAPPSILRVETLDHSGDGKIDHIRVVANEHLSDASADDSPTSAWSIDLKDGKPLINPSDVLGELVIGTSDDEFIYLELTGIAADRKAVLENAGLTPGVKYTKPASNPVTDTGTSPQPLQSTSDFLTALDKVAPRIKSAKTVDADADGRIDGYTFTFTELMNSNSMDKDRWATDDDRLVNSITKQSDGVYLMVFEEKSVYDTGDEPDLRYTAGDGKTTDSAGNRMESYDFAATLGGRDLTESDGAAPVIILSELNIDDGHDDFDILFSEPVKSSVTVGALRAEDFSYINVAGSGDAVALIIGVVKDETVGSVDGDEWSLQLGNAAGVRTDLSTFDVQNDKFQVLSTVVDLATPPNLGDTQGQITLTGIASDTIPPGTINDLSVIAETETSITLQWTTPTADDLTGGQSGFDIRYNTTEFTSSGYANAIQVTGEPAPQSGQVQTMEITGLTGNTDYWFAIRTRDAGGLQSGVSNVEPGATTEPDSTPPGAIASIAVVSDQVASDRAQLTWVAPGDDGASGGKVTSYEVKISTSSIGSGSSAFDGATDATFQTLFGSPAELGIAAPGSSQAAIISGLTGGTEYFVRVRAVDEAGNKGPISEQVSFTTLLDETPPTGALAITSSTHAEPSVATTASFSWSGLSDPDSAITYRYVRDANPNTEVTLAGTDAGGTSLTLQALSPGVHYLHVRGFSAGGPSATAHLPFEVVASLSPEEIEEANALLTYTVTRDGDHNVITWTLPAQADLPEEVTGIQIWRSDSPYELVTTVLKGTDAFGASSYQDDAGTATSSYFLQMVFRGGQSQYSGQGTDFPDTTEHSGITPTQTGDGGDGGDGGGEGDGIPMWVWILIIVLAIPFLVGIIVAIVIAVRRGREDEHEVVTAETEGGYAWPEEGEAEETPAGPAHQLECPNCKNRFTAYGEKPLTTTCTSCGKRGTLR